MFTEQEAKNKSCPLTFAIPDQRRADGAVVQVSGPWPCAGSDCMAWRWQDDPLQVTAHGLKRFGEGSLPDSESVKPNVNRRGYCGLAGNPNPIIHLPIGQAKVIG
jgi:hypothetical protein